MRLIAEELGGERGGEDVFSGVSFELSEGGSLIVRRPQRRRKIDTAQGRRRPAAGFDRQHPP